MGTLNRRLFLHGVMGAWVLVLATSSALRGQETLATISSIHFDAKYQRGVPERDVRKVVDFLESDYKYLNEKLGIALTKRIEVRIYDSVGKFLAEANIKRPWRVAIYSRGILHVQPVQALVQRRLFDQALSYELTTAFLEPVGDRGCPRWLRDAFSVYHSGELAVLTPPIGARLMAFSDLNQDIQEYPNPPQRDDVHYVLGHTIKFLVQKYGETKTFGIFKEFNGSTSVDKVFKKVFDEDFPAIEKSWAKYIGYRTSSFKQR